MPKVECHYDGEPVHTLAVSDRELKVMAAEPGGARFILFKRLQLLRRDLAITDFARFDEVVRLEPGER